MSHDEPPGVILPDVLEPALALVFCGTAAGARSARDRAYYAHPGNLFWRTVHAVGLTPRLLAPAEYSLMPAFGIGLTDLSKYHSGNDDQLPANAFDVALLRDKVARFAPRALAFTSKHAGRAALGRHIDFGRQPADMGGTAVFVLPSPSGQARRSWNLTPWRQLAAFVRDHPPGVER